MATIPDVSQAIVGQESTHSENRVIKPGVVGDVIECAFDVPVGMTGAELPKDGAFFPLALPGAQYPIGRTALGPFVCPTEPNAGDGAYYGQEEQRDGTRGPVKMHVRLVKLHAYGD